jgi:AraC family cel operon transcriptional repressor
MLIRRLESKNILNPVTGLSYAEHTVFSASTELHCHDFMELFIITGGRTGHLLNGQKRFLEKNSLVFVRPDDEHCYFDSSKDCKLVNLAFSVRFYNGMALFLGLEDFFEKLLDTDAPNMELTGLQTELLAQRMFDANVCVGKDPELSKAKFRSLLLDIFADLAESKRLNKREDTIPEWLNLLCSEMKKDKNMIRGLPVLKKKANCSYEHLCRAFKKHLNQTPTEFINANRLDSAAAMLSGTDEKINSVALDCGFENLSHFYHLFRKKYGMSPAKYRNETRKSAIPMS